MRTLGVMTAALVLLALTGCSGGENSSASSGVSAHAAAQTIDSKVTSASKVEDLSEKTDGNDLLGRPNGYKAATVIYDQAAECQGGPGVDCGAVVEQWPSNDAASKRADYIKSMGTIANEYDYVSGSLVLRVSGTLTPSVAKEYATAFGA